jgi:electron transport complex protein RnfB
VARAGVGHFYIDEAECIGCGACDHACPGKVDAIHPIPGDFLGRFMIELEPCIDCGFCVPLCPVDCIHDGRVEPGAAPTPVVEEPSGLAAWKARRA